MKCQRYVGDTKTWCNIYYKTCSIREFVKCAAIPAPRKKTKMVRVLGYAYIGKHYTSTQTGPSTKYRNVPCWIVYKKP